MRFLQPQLDVLREPVAGPVNWWEEGGATGAVAVYQPKGAASLAASYTDLSGNGNDATPGVAPTWDAGTGWTFNGSTQYLDSGIVPASGWTAIVAFDNAAGSGARDILGLFESAGAYRFYMRPRNFGINRVYGYGTGVNAPSGALTSGTMALAGVNTYLDGSGDGTISGSWSDPSPAKIYIGATQQKALSVYSAQNFFQGNTQAVAIYNTTLTGPQVAAITSAMQEL